MPIDQTNQRLFQAFAGGPSANPSDPVTSTQPFPAAPATSSLASPVTPVVAQPPTPPQPVPPQPAVVPPASPQTPQSDELALLEKVIAEAEQTVPQAVPTAMLQTVADATQAMSPGIGTGGKETIGAGGIGVKNVIEAGGSTQQVEYEPNPELPPEVEGYLNKTEQHQDQAPPEVVIGATSTALPTDRNLPSQPVVVLPITPEIEKAGMKQTPKFSIRWLVEWSHKIMKMFVGKVIYFQKT